ncbi:hypothetical protein [Micromonospora sp. NPDC050200]|uniref:hypothetical protein n=1 Tax=Micromonospora sp. NPDC050200 TaxID=3155664 RepID=UPI0033E3A8CA
MPPPRPGPRSWLARRLRVAADAVQRWADDAGPVPPAEVTPDLPRRPGQPPEHWLRLVAAHAPGLLHGLDLDPDAPPDHAGPSTAAGRLQGDGVRGNAPPRAGGPARADAPGTPPAARSGMSGAAWAGGPGDTESPTAGGWPAGSAPGTTGGWPDGGAPGTAGRWPDGGAPGTASRWLDGSPGDFRAGSAGSWAGEPDGEARPGSAPAGSGPGRPAGSWPGARTPSGHPAGGPGDAGLPPAASGRGPRRIRPAVPGSGPDGPLDPAHRRGHGGSRPATAGPGDPADPCTDHRPVDPAVHDRRTWAIGHGSAATTPAAEGPPGDGTGTAAAPGAHRSGVPGGPGGDGIGRLRFPAPSAVGSRGAEPTHPHRGLVAGPGPQSDPTDLARTAGRSGGHPAGAGANLGPRSDGGWPGTEPGVPSTDGWTGAGPAVRPAIGSEAGPGLRPADGDTAFGPADERAGAGTAFRTTEGRPGAGTADRWAGADRGTGPTDGWPGPPSWATDPWPVLPGEPAGHGAVGVPAVGATTAGLAGRWAGDPWPALPDDPAWLPATVAGDGERLRRLDHEQRGA